MLSGILNGIDDDGLESGDRRRISPHASTPSGSTRARRNKAALQARFGLDADADAPLFGVVSRLTWQKGIDLLLEALPALLGERRAARAARLRRRGARGRLHRRRRARIPDASAASSATTRRWRISIQAGADALLVPSRFEPCGLTQLCALRYGASPVVARVGGLADTVIDANEMALAAGVGTGVQFAPGHARARSSSRIDRAVALCARPRRRGGGCSATAWPTDVSWRGPAKRYAALYRELVAHAPATA